jgi:hypothetical protein
MPFIEALDIKALAYTFLKVIVIAYILQLAFIAALLLTY